MPITKHIFITASLAITFALSASNAIAKPPMRDGKPPLEAIEACLDKIEGQAVSFTTKRGHDLEGSCEMIEGQLVAVPEHHPMKRGNPEQESHPPKNTD